MKASDYSVSFESGLFNCCAEHIQSDDSEVKENSVIECDHCGIEMILLMKNGALFWCRN